MSIWAQSTVIVVIGLALGGSIYSAGKQIVAEKRLALYMGASRDCSYEGRAWMCGCRTRVHKACTEWSCRCLRDHDKTSELDRP